MNRTDVVRIIADEETIPVAQVERVLDQFLNVVAESLAEQEEVNLRGFGKFQPRRRSPVTRKNPRTGILHEVPEKWSVGFVPSPNLKTRLNPN